MTQPIEAKKDGLAQLQDGCWTLKLKVHLNDMPKWLMAAPMGTRLACAIVEIGDDEKPVPHEKDELSPAKKAYAAKSEGEQAVTRAVMLCKDEMFIFWIRSMGVETSPRTYLLVECGIESRSKLASNILARERFLNIEQRYREATGQTAEPRG